MIVIDIGCATYGGDQSIPYLVDEFKPGMLLGYDPAAEAAEYVLENTLVVVRQEAAWTYDGEIGFMVAGLGGHIDLASTSVPCVDIVRVINSYPDEEVVLKIDAEGAEYVLLPHIYENDADLRLKLAWVEWHCDACGRGGGHRPGCQDREMERLREEIEDMMRCEMHQWNR